VSTVEAQPSAEAAAAAREAAREVTAMEEAAAHALTEDMRDDMRWLQRDYIGAPKEANAANTAILDRLNSTPHIQRTNSRKKGLTEPELNLIAQKVANNPIAGLCNLNKYAPGVSTDFCFGRAMAVHLEALLSGVQKEDIKKVWAIGNMKYGSSTLEFHVATLVRRSDGRWYAVDSDFGGVLSVEDWHSKIRSLKDPAVRVFVTDSQRFTPGMDEIYARKALSLQGYRNYFNDLLSYFRNEARSIRQNQAP